MSRRHTVLRLAVGQFSHPGRRRENNEDWLGVFQPDDVSRLVKKGSLFLVADGMGGHQSGELASRRAVDQVIRHYVDVPSADVGTGLREAIESANATLYTEATGREARKRWGTTLVAAVVRRDELWIANVGDSRAYLLRGGKLRQLSRDHDWAAATPGADLPADWIGHHVITRALGLKPRVKVDIFPPLTLRTGDRVLLCSDGLTTPLSDGEIRDIALRFPPQKAAEALVKAANAQGGPDNVSVVLIHVAGQQAVPIWEAARDILATWTWSEIWQRLQRGFPVEGVNFRSPLFIGAIVLLVLVLIGLGFLLGLAIF